MMCGDEVGGWVTAPADAGASLLGRVESAEGFYSRFNFVVLVKDRANKRKVCLRQKQFDIIYTNRFRF